MYLGKMKDENEDLIFPKTAVVLFVNRILRFDLYSVLILVVVIEYTRT